MQKVGRNDPCPCGSGKKFKKCCEMKAGPKKINAQLISSTQGASKVSSLFLKKTVANETPKPEHPDLIL